MPTERWPNGSPSSSLLPELFWLPDESEQAVGFYTMIEDSLVVPFKTETLGVEVTVKRIELTKDDRLVAICARGKARQRVLVLDLPLPDPPPKGSEWIHADRRWARGS